MFKGKELIIEDFECSVRLTDSELSELHSSVLFAGVYGLHGCSARLFAGGSDFAPGLVNRHRGLGLSPHVLIGGGAEAGLKICISNESPGGSATDVDAAGEEGTHGHHRCPLLGSPQRTGLELG